LQINTEFVDRFLAPGISTFTSCDAPDISAAHPEAGHWLTNHFLNSLLRSHYKDKVRQFAINQLMRAQTAFGDYHEARNLTNDYLRLGLPDNPATRTYFKAIGKWESCFLNIQIFVEVMNWMKKELGDSPVFEKGDATPVQRAHLIANSIKHWGRDIANGRHAPDDTIPMWLTNNGFSTRLTTITYAELAGLVAQLATEADVLQDPLTFVTPK
jgi:hypothetical protein